MSGTSAPLRYAAIDIASPVTQVQRSHAVRVEIVEDLARVEPIWRRLEGADVIASPYQRFDWIAPWQREVGARTGVTPFFVVGHDAADVPAFLWPLGRMKLGPLTVARFLGGKHANYNIPLWRRDAALAMDADKLPAIVAQIAGAEPRIDLLQLFNQPEGWDGVPNPLAALPHQPSPSFAYRGRLSRDFEAMFAERASTAARRKIRKHERSLASHGKVRSWRAETVEDAARVLEAFFAQRAERMRELGLANVFAEPGVREFITQAATVGLADGNPAIELYAMDVDGEIVATFGAVLGGGRISLMITSITRGPLAHKSPGQLLLVNLVRMCCERGIPVIDLGVGEARYKQLFCDEPEPLFDSFIGLTPMGRLAAAGSRTAYVVKGRMKRTPVIWSAIAAARRLRGVKPAAE